MPGATGASSNADNSDAHDPVALPVAPVPRTLAQRVRFYVVWAARLLLPIVFALSLVKPVVIPPSSKSQSPSSSIHDVDAVTPLLIITHSRADYLRRALTSVLAHHPGGPAWPIVVSKDQQDGEHPAVDAVIAELSTTAAARGITLLQWAHAFNYPDEPDPEHPFVDMPAYRRIARHYAWALRRVFSQTSSSSASVAPAPSAPAVDSGSLPTAPAQVIILEDDMEIAPDFYTYFDTLRPLLHADQSLLCVSAWNDNGIPSLSLNSSQLYRTDFFPGLGWMLTADLWEELAPHWPPVFWDDWLRHPDRTRGRQCVRPEVSRVANFGEKGVSQSFHFTKHVSRVVRANDSIPFEELDLSYLQQDEYHRMFFSRMSNATRLRFSNHLTSRPQDSDVIAFYPEEYLEPIGKRTGIMADHRNGVRRTSYHGVIVIPWNGHWAFIVKRGWEPPEGYTVGARDCCQ